MEDRMPAGSRGDRQVFVYRFDFGGGEREVVSLLESDWAFRHGLRADGILGSVRAGANPDDLGPADVEENDVFVRLLSTVVQDNIGQSDFLRREARKQGAGYVYLIDGRTSNPGGRVPPEDILGAVEVKDGQGVAGSYRHNPRHRLLTAAGWFRLPDELESALQRRLRVRTAD
ncbi:hypothetical protein Are01nite_72780 [Actinoplanes regularis]|nr:hypothetical protein Are01nite_72780 [Actinoplanes regularis]